MSDPERQEPISVAMSGGVDSSIAAALLVEAGHDVFGVTMRLGDDDEAIERASSVARHLGIDHHVVDCREAFREKVLYRCWVDYSRGRTPNPCVICNRTIKFGVLAEAAKTLGGGMLATGHHARLLRSSEGDAPLLCRGADTAKDQSYFLARLSPSQLSKALFPVGTLTKAQVREAARNRGIPSAEAPESQDTCIALSGETRGREGAFAETLRRMFGALEARGTFVDLDGHILGHHEGVHLFTVGQRRGLGIALGRRAYVTRIDAGRRQVVITTDPSALQMSTLRASEMIWHQEPPRSPRHCQVQIRYRHRPTPAIVSCLDENAIVVDFVEPVTAVTPGQAAVVYDEEEVLGCGWIDTTHHPIPL